MVIPGLIQGAKPLFTGTMIATTLDLLIIGAGWTSTFLIPLCQGRRITYAATTRSGRLGTIKFEFDPHSDDSREYEVLPAATTVLITFPITVQGASERLVRHYLASHGSQKGAVQFIQLGTTSMWDELQHPERPILNRWYDRHSPFISNGRTIAEEELLALHPTIPTTVLNLSGLWGGERSVRNWVIRVAPTKETLKAKGSLHLIHGIDVSRAILAVIAQFPKASGQRWILTDGRVYDWWDLASAWMYDGPRDEQSHEFGSPKNKFQGPHATWVRELMGEEGIRALPRCVDVLGRALDSREFWVTFGLSPAQARLEDNR